MTLRDRLLRVLDPENGGARKYNVLRAHAERHGYTEAQFRKVLEHAIRDRLIKRYSRIGGPHFRLA